MPRKPPTHRVPRPATPVHHLAAKAPHAPIERWGKGRGGRPWRRLRIAVFERDLYTCQCGCERIGREHELDVDHKMPIAEGGTEDMDNLQTLLRFPCHRDKTAREAARRRASTSVGGQPLARSNETGSHRELVGG